MFYNQATAEKFVDCFNAKCFCDRPCGQVHCMINPDCENIAEDVSSLDGVTPACKSCKKKLAQKFEAFACTRV
jgi:hypothetical protein